VKGAREVEQLLRNGGRDVEQLDGLRRCRDIDPLVEPLAQPDAPQLDQERHLPQRNGAERGSLRVRICVESGTYLSGEWSRPVEPPEPRVGVEQRRSLHRSASISFSRTTGDRTSPTNVALPRRRSQGFRGVGGGGASCATIRPRFVISTGRRVRRTSSIRRRQCALNSVAVTVTPDQLPGHVGGVNATAPPRLQPRSPLRQRTHFRP